MILVTLALAVLPAPCANADLRAALLAVHEVARTAHLNGDAALMGSTVADQLVQADGGGVRVQSNAEVTNFFANYFKRVRYSQWRDAGPGRIEISPDGRLGWMAVAIEAKYTRTDQPAAGEKTFKSSWIATYRRDGCNWKTTGIASNIVE